jgi:hypothetical protein
MFSNVKHFFAVPITALILAVGLAQGAQAESWNIYGSSSSCPSCMHVASQGTINISSADQTVTFSGWASTVFAGGYGADVTMYNHAKTQVTYVNANTTYNTPHEVTRTVDGSSQINVSNSIHDTYSSFYLWTAKVYSNGWVESPDFYYSAVATGDRGV